MTGRRSARRGLGGWTVALSLLALLALGCGRGGDEPALSKLDDDTPLPEVKPPPEDGPRLGAVAASVPVLAAPADSAAPLGYLRAGALVARSEKPVRKTEKCQAGYYAIFPRGVVCLDQGATLALEHPTLAAMAIRPSLNELLPYAYARAEKKTPLLERDPENDEGARILSELPEHAGLAVVGSWTARVAGGPMERLALLLSGRFVRAEDLEAATPSAFSGLEVGEGSALPAAFVVKRGVRGWKLKGDLPEKQELLDYHSLYRLTGRYRTVSGVKYWATESDSWLRHQDVTLVHQRTKMPDFVAEGTRWMDLSVVTGGLVLYEGKRAVFATLASVGKDRLGDPAKVDEPQAVTKLGTFEVVAKHATFLRGDATRAGEKYPLYDLPWALELSSGQLLYGAYWHDRFGIEHGPGDIMVSPGDARRIFQWVAPELPKGWDAVSTGDDKVRLVVRK